MLIINALSIKYFLHKTFLKNYLDLIVYFIYFATELFYYKKLLKP